MLAPKSQLVGGGKSGVMGSYHSIPRIELGGFRAGCSWLQLSRTTPCTGVLRSCPRRDSDVR